jgi:hypothetical protein
MSIKTRFTVQSLMVHQFLLNLAAAKGCALALAALEAAKELSPVMALAVLAEVVDEDE